MEIKFIRDHHSSNPEIGYDRFPPYKPGKG